MAKRYVPTLDRISSSLARALYLLVAAVLASVAAGFIGLHLVFGREFLAAFDDSGLPLVFIMLTYAVAPGIAGLLAIHGLLRVSPKSRVFDLVVFVLLAAGFGFLLFLVPSVMAASPDGPGLAATLGPMAAYQTVSGAVGGLIFWLLAGRWRPARSAGLSAADIPIMIRRPDGLRTPSEGIDDR